jgi:hypothetical protein
MPEPVPQPTLIPLRPVPLEIYLFGRMPQAVETAVFALSEGLAHWEDLAGTGPSGLRRLSEPLLLPSATAAAAASYAK